MSVNGKFKDITREDLLLDAERFGVRRPVRLLEILADAVGSFDQFAKEAGMQAQRIDAIRNHFVLG
jgi:serine/threonine-protein kinase HipA